MCVGGAMHEDEVPQQQRQLPPQVLTWRYHDGLAVAMHYKRMNKVDF